MRLDGDVGRQVVVEHREPEVLVVERDHARAEPRAADHAGHGADRRDRPGPHLT